MFPLTHWHSCALTSVQGVFSTHSLAITRTHKQLTSIQGEFNTHSKELTRTHKRSGRVQFWHKWDRSHGHTMVSRIQKWLNGCSYSLNGCSHSLNGIHVHSMGALTHWHSCALNRCSGAVPTHSLVFTCTHKHSGGVQYMFSLFMYLKAQWICFQMCEARKGPINLLSISIECYFFGFAKQEDMMSHLNTWLAGSLGVCQWDWQQKIWKYCNNLEN